MKCKFQCTGRKLREMEKLPILQRTLLPLAISPSTGGLWMRKFHLNQVQICKYQLYQDSSGFESRA